MANLSRGAATVTTALLGAIVLLTTLPTWVRATTPTATGDLPVTVSGTSAAPAAASVGLVIIAAALVLGLAGKAVRVIALVGIIAANLAAGATVVMFLAEPDIVAATAAADLTSVRAINTPVTVTWWPYLSLAVLAAGIATSGWLLTHLGTWQTVGRRYQPAARAETETPPPAADPQTRSRRQAMDDWDAISRGEDPT